MKRYLLNSIFLITLSFITACTGGTSPSEVASSISSAISGDTTVSVSGVSINKTVTTILEGSTETLYATVSPDNAADKSVTWSTSNSSVAGVDTAGLVTAVAVGTATITVTTTDGSKQALCQVTVAAAPVSVSSITLVKSKTYISVGASEQMYANIVPLNATDQEIVWASSNTAIATVDTAGLVTAVAAGTAKITATTHDGGKVSTVIVNVAAISIPVTGITIDKSETYMLQGGTEQLSVTITPSNATNQKLIWSVEDEVNIRVSSSGMVTALFPVLTKTVTVKTVDGDFTATISVHVASSGTAVTGLTLNKDSASIISGRTELLVPTISPATATNQNIIWTSSDPTVAVPTSGGRVVPLKLGTTTITAKTVDGNFTDTCNITVINYDYADDDFTGNETSAAAHNLGDVSYAGATHKVTYSGYINSGAGDKDFIKFNAVDPVAGSYNGTTKNFHVRIRFVKNPDNAYGFRVWTGKIGTDEVLENGTGNGEIYGSLDWGLVDNETQQLSSNYIYNYFATPYVIEIVKHESISGIDLEYEIEVSNGEYLSYIYPY